MAIYRTLCFVICLFQTGPLVHAAAAAQTEASEQVAEEAVLARQRLSSALELSCVAPLLDPAGFGERLGATVIVADTPPVRGPADVTRWSIEYSDRAAIRLDFIRMQAVLRQIVLRYVQTTSSASSSSSGQPLLEIMADSDCNILRGREIIYEQNKPVSLAALDSNLERGEIRDPFNPPLVWPLEGNGSSESDEQPARLPVAVVDSGVDYRSDRLLTRLHRNADGTLVGYDYWDDDALPFDSNPARTPFYPQRHGTRIANIIIEESDVAVIAPYRYPRTDPTRFVDLIDAIEANDIRIVNLSMGSKKEELWSGFEQAARAKSNILFVVSAGNDGVNIDDQPIYPAAFALDNILTVTSALPGGELAEDSNWGPTAVDVMVEGEQVLTYGFADRLRTVSGSSYAVARVSALASCLLAANTKLSSADLKKKIISLASQPEAADRAATQFGYLPLSLNEHRGLCVAQSEQLVELRRDRIIEPIAAAPEEQSFGLSLTAVVVDKSGWNHDEVRENIERAIAILKQCRVRQGAVDLVEVTGPRSIRLMSDESMRALSEFVPSESVRLFFVEETLREIEFGAEAIGRVNARRRPWLRDTVWLTRWVPDPAYSLAHELFHVLADSGLHSKTAGNLMAEFTSQLDESIEPALTPSQCGQLRNIGLGNKLLDRP